MEKQGGTGMRNLYQLYAFVTLKGWKSSLSTRWPDAPLIGDYRLLVFTNKDLPKLKQEYDSAVFKELDRKQTIDAMTAGDIGPFICDLVTAKAISLHFNPQEEITS